MGSRRRQAIIEDSRRPNLPLEVAGAVAIVVGLVAGQLFGTGTGMAAGLGLGVVAFVVMRLRGRGRARTAPRFAVGDRVRAIDAAAKQFRPGKVGIVRALRDDPNMPGKQLCVVEYPDRSKAEIPEGFLEELPEVPASPRRQLERRRK
jgi:hypothetical protein